MKPPTNCSKGLLVAGIIIIVLAFISIYNQINVNLCSTEKAKLIDSMSESTKTLDECNKLRSQLIKDKLLVDDQMRRIQKTLTDMQLDNQITLDINSELGSELQKTRSALYQLQQDYNERLETIQQISVQLQNTNANTRTVIVNYESQIQALRDDVAEARANSIGLSQQLLSVQNELMVCQGV